MSARERKPKLVPDRGESWVVWEPERALTDDRLARAVSQFEAVDCPAGAVAEAWLREDALPNHPSTITHLLILDGQVEAFYALCSASVELTEHDQHDLRLRLATQPATLIAWLAKRRGCVFPGIEIVGNAGARARQIARTQGVIALVLDPYDDITATLWRKPPYEFKKSRTRGPRGRWRLYKSLFPVDASARDRNLDG